MSESLLAPSFLFHFAAPCHRRSPVWQAKDFALEEKYRLPSFGELDGRPLFAELRAAWSEDGLSFTLQVSGKKQSPWCREARPEESDGLQVWIDTRETRNVHRAGRFCHRFFFLPRGAGKGLADPCADQLTINRAKEHPKSIPPGLLRVQSEKRIDGYLLASHIPATAMTGFDPVEHPRLGFSYAVIDRELGWQTFSVGPEFPFQEDPSLWGVLELVREAVT
jgi:hypothetical protein